jgi:hypothetical protein
MEIGSEGAAFAHMSAKHLQPYADQLIFEDTRPLGQVSEKIGRQGHKNGHTPGQSRLFLMK